jgi:hypothetical protein
MKTVVPNRKNNAELYSLSSMRLLCCASKVNKPNVYPDLVKNSFRPISQLGDQAFVVRLIGRVSSKPQYGCYRHLQHCQAGYRDKDSNAIKSSEKLAYVRTVCS